MSTQASYRSHLRLYIKFCESIKCSPLPANNDIVCRYAAFLARSKAVSTVRQYLNIIRLINLQFGLPNPLCEWQVKSVVGGIKRKKGDQVEQKAPILVSHLEKLYAILSLENLAELQFWTGCLLGFFGLLRVSNFTSHPQKGRDMSVTRQDLTFGPRGCIVRVSRSKTNQHRSRVHEIVLPHIPAAVYCPVSTMLRFLGKTTDVPASAPILSIATKTSIASFTQDAFRSKLTSSLKQLGMSKSNYNTHSLRRGGATWLLSNGTPLAMVKAIGDWSSDAVFAYLKPTADMKFDVFAKCLRH